MKNLLVKMALATLPFAGMPAVIGMAEKPAETITSDHTYAEMWRVVDIAESDSAYKVTFVNDNGRMYIESCSDADFNPGDTFAVVMYDNQTPYVMDDKPISIKYQRPDLLDYAELDYIEMRR